MTVDSEYLGTQNPDIFQGTSVVTGTTEPEGGDIMLMIGVDFESKKFVGINLTPEEARDIANRLNELADLNNEDGNA